MMKLKTHELVQIKHTKSISMSADNEGVTLFIEKSGEHVWIPNKIIFQIHRGLTSYIQKYYRRHDKKAKKA